MGEQTSSRFAGSDVGGDLKDGGCDFALDQKVLEFAREPVAAMLLRLESSLGRHEEVNHLTVRSANAEEAVVLSSFASVARLAAV